MKSPIFRDIPPTAEEIDDAIWSARAARTQALAALLRQLPLLLRRAGAWLVVSNGTRRAGARG